MFLNTTVREEVAGCSEQAYPSLTVAEALRLLLFNSDQEASAFAAEVSRYRTDPTLFIPAFLAQMTVRQAPKPHRGNSPSSCTASPLLQRGWELRDGRLYFQPQEKGDDHGVNAMEVISNSMTYARELERIV